MHKSINRPPGDFGEGLSMGVSTEKAFTKYELLPHKLLLLKKRNAIRCRRKFIAILLSEITVKTRVKQCD